MIIENFKNACHEVVQYIDDQHALKQAVNQRLYNFVKDQKARDEDVNQNIKMEYENQKKFLENSMHSLKKRLEVESQIHKADNLKIMSDNMDLITKISTARTDCKNLTKRKKAVESDYKKACNQYGYKPQSKDELDEADPLSDNSRIRSLQGRSEDDETLFNLRRDTEARRKHVEMLKSNIEEARQE